MRLDRTTRGLRLGVSEKETTEGRSLSEEDVGVGCTVEDVVDALERCEVLVSSGRTEEKSNMGITIRDASGKIGRQFLSLVELAIEV